VTGSILSTAPTPPVEASPPASPTRELKLTPRPEALPGATYKIKWPDSPHAVYVTLNDVDDGDGPRPFEIFINSKNMEHYAWTLGLTRMISAVFRRGGDVSFVAEELKAVFDPRGGGWLGGRYVPSLLAAIGGVIERHLERDRVMICEHGIEPAPSAAPVAPAATASKACCPRCGAGGLVRKEGCDTCFECGYSKCG
jgi:ribonucleoside-diphosphate reductase alpha chain